MTAKHAPATPLPWNMQDGGRSSLAHVEREDNGEQVCSVNKRRVADAAYIAHACNAYPRLVETLRELMVRCDGDEGVRADGSNIQTMAGHALLDELGEGEAT